MEIPNGLDIKETDKKLPKSRWFFQHKVKKHFARIRKRKSIIKQLKKAVVPDNPKNNTSFSI